MNYRLVTSLLTSSARLFVIGVFAISTVTQSRVIDLQKEYQKHKPFIKAVRTTDIQQLVNYLDAREKQKAARSFDTEFGNLVSCLSLMMQYDENKIDAGKKEVAIIAFDDYFYLTTFIPEQKKNRRLMFPHFFKQGDIGKHKWLYHDRDGYKAIFKNNRWIIKSIISADGKKESGFFEHKDFIEFYTKICNN